MGRIRAFHLRILAPVFLVLTALLLVGVAPAAMAAGVTLVAPAFLSATACSNTQIRLEWNDPNGSETGYSVELLTGTKVTKVFATGPNVTSWSATGLAANTAYSYRVRAKALSGHTVIYSKSASPIANATTLLAGAPTPDQCRVVITPAVSTFSPVVALSLSAPTAFPVTGYYVSTNATRPLASASGWTTVTSATGFKVNVDYDVGTVEGSKTVYAWYKGATGNVSATVSGSIIVDRTSPACTVVINGGAAATAAAAVTLTLSAADTVGVTGYYVSTDATPPAAGAAGWTPVASTTSYNGGTPYTLVSGDGSKTVYAWYKDAAGNVSTTASDAIVLDQTAPSTSSNAAAG